MCFRVAFSVGMFLYFVCAFFLSFFFFFGLNGKKRKKRKKSLRARPQNAPSVQVAATAFVTRRLLYPQTSSFNISVKSKVAEST